MKFTLKEIDKALDWIKENSYDVDIDVKTEGHKLIFKCNDKYEAGVEIEVYDTDTSFQPRITKVDFL
jgi:hypothetical protein